MKTLDGLVTHARTGSRAKYGKYTFVGQGCARSVWKMGNLVFKIEKIANGPGVERQNETEFKHYQHIISSIKIPSIWGIPEMDLITLDNGEMIVQADFVPGQRLALNESPWTTNDHFDKEIDEFRKLTGLIDLYEHNVIYDGKKLWAIDLGV